MRIKFTKQLIKLRDDTVTEVVFSNELTNIERKFLHKLSEQLGLKSKSSGMNENRKITVTKLAVAANQQTDEEFHKYEMNARTSDLLKTHFTSENCRLPVTNSRTNADTANGTTEFKNAAYSKPSTLQADAVMLRAAYTKAQSERQKKPSYAVTEQKRSLLPASSYKEAVSSLIKQEQIVLVSGETGCGKSE